MGKLDVIAKSYMSRADRFADAFNYFLYDGRQVVEADALHELDTTEITVPIQRLRDLLKSWKILTDDKIIYVLLGVEIQGKIHYAMPVKNMLYDAMNYADQVKQQGHKNRSANINISSAEFLSGVKKNDKLIPVVNLTIYFGPEKWEGAKSLHELFDYDYKEILDYVPDYKLNLISPENIDANDFGKFKTQLGQVLEYIKYSKDKKKLLETIQNNDNFKEVDAETVELINEATGSKLKYKEKEGKVDMCQAIMDLKKDAMLEGKIQAIVELVKDDVITVAEAAKRLNISPEEFQNKYM